MVVWVQGRFKYVKEPLVKDFEIRGQLPFQGCSQIISRDGETADLGLARTPVQAQDKVLPSVIGIWRPVTHMKPFINRSNT